MRDADKVDSHRLGKRGRDIGHFGEIFSANGHVENQMERLIERGREFGGPGTPFVLGLVEVAVGIPADFPYFPFNRERSYAVRSGLIRAPGRSPIRAPFFER